MNPTLACSAIVFLALNVSASSDECEAMAAKTIDATGLSVARRSTETLFFNRPEPGIELSLNCGKFIYAFAGYGEARLPPRSFFRYVGGVGAAVLPVSITLVAEKAKKCQLKALRDPDNEQSEVLTGGRLLCSVGENSIAFTIQREGK